MQDSTAANGLIARAANRHLSKADREAAGVLSSAQRHTHFLDSPRMAAVMARSDFRFAQLKDTTASVFLVLPPDRLGTYSRWLRLMVAQAITDMARSPIQPPSPVLFLPPTAASSRGVPGDIPPDGKRHEPCCAPGGPAAARPHRDRNLNRVYFEKRSFSSSGSRVSLTQRRSAMTKGSRFRRPSKSAARWVRASALAWQW